MEAKRYNGGAIMVAVALSLVVTTLITLVLLLFDFRVRENLLTETKMRSSDDRHSVEAFALADTATSSLKGDVKLIINGLDSIKVKKTRWGVYNLISATKNSRDYHLIPFLYGDDLSQTLPYALCVVDHNRPVVATGTTRIYGNAYVPGGKIGKISFENLSSSTVFIEGQTLSSATSLPPLKAEMFSQLNELKSLYRNKTNPLKNNEIPDSISVSFKSSPEILRTNERIVLSNKILSGQLIIVSRSEIQVTAAAQLTDVILCAPVINISAGFHGTIQAFAEKAINVGPNCLLKYPSALTLTSSDSPVRPTLSIGTGCQIAGSIITNGFENESNQPITTVASGALIYGVLYCQGYLNLSGKVVGTVLTDFFQYHSPTATYENHLVNTNVSRAGLNGAFVLPAIFEGSNTKIHKVVKWLK